MTAVATVTCHNSGCENAEQAIPDVEQPTDEDTGAPVDPWLIVCGVCDNPITDITE